MVFKRGYVQEDPVTKKVSFKDEYAQHESIARRVKFLGLNVDDHLSFKFHVDHVCSKVAKIIHLFRKLTVFMKTNELVNMYHSLIYPHLTYGVIAWGYCAENQVQRILKLQKWMIRIILGRTKTESCRNEFVRLKMLTFPNIFIYFVSVYMYKQTFENTIVKNSTIHQKNTRTACNVHIPFCRSSVTQKAPKYIGAIIYNRVPQAIKNEPNLKTFKKCLKKYLQNNQFYSFKEFFS
jgi:hypothetical protein